MSTIFYAVKFPNGVYWHRKISPTPALFLTKERAIATIKMCTGREEHEYEIVTFMEIE